jgi:hypothetical protein
MAVNIDPVFTKKGDQSNNNSTGMNQLVLAASTDYTGIDTDASLIFTASADGAYIKGIKAVAGGTNTASVARFFLNNGATVATATNNTMIGQLSLPGTTAINTAATAEPFYPLEMAIPASFRIYVGLATAVAAGWAFHVVGGQYTA